MITVEEGDGLDGTCDECESAGYFDIGIRNHSHVQLCESHFKELRDRINAPRTVKDA